MSTLQPFDEKKVEACPFKLEHCLNIRYLVLKMGFITYQMARDRFVCVYGYTFKLSFHCKCNIVFFSDYYFFNPFPTSEKNLIYIYGTEAKQLGNGIKMS